MFEKVSELFARLRGAGRASNPSVSTAAEPFHELRFRLREESAEQDRLLHEGIRRHLTPEQLRQDWNRARGHHSGS